MGDTAVDRHITVSVNGQQVKALLDFNAMENAVAWKTVKVDPKLKMYDFQDRDKASSKWRLGARGVVWLPVVIGSRADKLRCVVVDGLTEKLIIGLPGLSYLGASVNFSTGDVRISRRRRRRKGEGCATAKMSDEVHEDCELVRDARMKCMESEGATELGVVPRKSPEKECTKSLLPVQVKDLAGRGGSRDNDGHSKEDPQKPNQKKKKEALVSGRGRKEGEVNVVSPKLEEKLTTIIPIPSDHDDEESDGECNSGCEDADESEELEQRSNGSAKVGKRAHKAKRKKSKKKKGKRRK